MTSYQFSDFLSAHKSQLEAGGVPPELWGCLYGKLCKEQFDAGESFRLECEQTEEGRVKWSALALKDMHPVDEDCVFLIDHAWTFRPHQARSQLEQMPELLERMKSIMDIDHDEENSGDCSEDEVTSEEKEKAKVDEKAGGDANALPRHESVDARLCFSVKQSDSDVDRVLRKMWQYVNTYTVRYKTAVDEEGMPLWYVMDEFGSRIPHSDTPNVRIVPLFFVPHGIAYNVLFLVKEIKEEEEVFRDYVDTAMCKQHPEWRELLLAPWRSQLAPQGSSERSPLDDQFFLSGRSVDALPSEEDQAVARGASQRKVRKLNIFADDTQLVEHLKEVQYELVDDWKKADVLWMMKHFHQYGELCTSNPAALVNQFPYESCLNVKDLLSAIVMQMNGGKGPAWFQSSFNLSYELPQFVAEYQRRAESGEDNTWIVKPWNLARGMDMHVTDDIGQVVRLIESGPKIACKYISRPLLFPRRDSSARVKFDLRYIVFVDQLRPLRAFVYNKFWIRFAINEFSMNRLDDIETHFTVFNYADEEKILQMDCSEFISQLEAAYPMLKWDGQVQKQINQVLKETMEAVSSNCPPRGVASNVQSRAMYGADIMLQWNDEAQSSLQATLLECNFMPDCKRACQYYPDFADTVFKTMFLDDIDSTHVTPL